MPVVRHVHVYTLAIAGLMVSRLPVLSGKKMGTRVPPEMVAPVILVVVLFIALLVSYPWVLLTVGTLVYIACLPLGWFSYQRYLQADAAAGASAAAAPAESAHRRAGRRPRQPTNVRRGSTRCFASCASSAG